LLIDAIEHASNLNIALKGITAMTKTPIVSILMPTYNAKDSIIDTLESIECFCKGTSVVIVDDHSTDGTYEELLRVKQPNWHIIRNERRYGWHRITHTLCRGYLYILKIMQAKLVLRLDQDALIIKEGLLDEACAFAHQHSDIGIFGVYREDYNRPRSFEYHKRIMDHELNWIRFVLMKPWWHPFLKIAEDKGYHRGENVYGGAYFITKQCLESMQQAGALNIPFRWNSKLSEDVYFSMVTIAVGYRLGHFAAPEGPLCLESNALPYPAEDLLKSKYKLVHSVDKGLNTGLAENNGMTAREVFRQNRREMH
jgi:glycosyltransferase involved in cell wall biosynthesis